VPSHKEITQMFMALGKVNTPNIETLSRENPLQFSPKQQVAINCGEILSFTAWTYERFNGTEVLRIDAATTVHTVFNLEQIQEWVLVQNGRSPFATIRVQHVNGESLQLLVTHSLLVSELTEFQLQETLQSLTYVWEQCAQKLDDMDPIDLAEDESDDGDDSDDELIRTIEQFRKENDANDIFGRQGEGTLISVDKDISVESVLQELEALIGLEPVKNMVKQLTAQQRIAQQRAAHGLRAVVPSPHLVFMGNPGTGKTTVARLIGKLYKALGLLSEGQVVEADRSSLVAGYIGQTAIKTRDMCKRAIGGVLFIDEAYSLSVDGRDFGAESIEALLTFMEAHRGNFVVVVAGYPDRMLDFLNSNPGLKSRFDLTLDFPDYSSSELVRIFENLMEDNQYQLTTNARIKVENLINSWPRDHSFGNGREVRRLFNNVVGNHAALLGEKSSVTSAALQTVTSAAIPEVTPLINGAETTYRMPGYL
jgi:AAA+ superfamily predicted ATPase